MPRLFNRAAVTVGVAEVQIVAANPTRKKLIICQTSANAIRVGVTGVLATTGVRLGAAGTTNDRLVLEGVDCPTDAIFAIREGGVDGTVSAIEVADA